MSPHTHTLANDRYLFPAERDAILLNLYMRAIMEGTVTKQRAPVPYWLAVHHLVAFLFGGGQATSEAAGAAASDGDGREPLDSVVRCRVCVCACVLDACASVLMQQSDFPGAPHKLAGA